MTNDRSLLGMRLKQALECLAREGLTPQIEWTAAPRGAHESGDARVVRANDGRLTVARFPGAIELGEAMGADARGAVDA